MRLLNLSLAALAAFGGAGGSAFPAAAQEPQRIIRFESGQCGLITGFVFSPEALTVHERPDGGSPVLGEVQGFYEGDDAGRGPEVRVLDARDGWLRIIDAHDDESLLDGAEPREMYSGVGWVRGEGVYVVLQTSKAFAAPGHGAPVVLESLDGGWLEEVANQVAVTGCQDGWVLARWNLSAGKPERHQDYAVVSRDPVIVEGWSTGVCAIQETTCDGVNGDVPQER